MIIDTVGRVWGFAIVITAVAMFFSELLNVLIFPAEILRVTMTGTAFIASVVGMPLALWIGNQMREKALLQLQLQALVDRDRLTDVATRDFFFQQLHAAPDAYGVSLMVDIDHFKAVNDTYGHLVGDQVIRSVANVLREQVRERDIVCRFGGEEFLIFLQKASPEDGWAIAERIRESAEALTTSSTASDIKVTVSIGGSLKDKIEDVEEAIRRADACLYRAKKLGRNRTVVDWRLTTVIAPQLASTKSGAKGSRAG